MAHAPWAVVLLTYESGRECWGVVRTRGWRCLVRLTCTPGELTPQDERHARDVAEKLNHIYAGGE